MLSGVRGAVTMDLAPLGVGYQLLTFIRAAPPLLGDGMREYLPQVGQGVLDSAKWRKTLRLGGI